MDRTLRMVMAISLAVLGVYYALLGTSTLLNLTDVTWRWIRLSGDPDFKFDFELFRMFIALGALGISVLGLATVACGAVTASGRGVAPGYWAALAMAALFLHVPWFLYRVVGTGLRTDSATEIRAVAIRFAAVCMAYVFAWALTRRESVGRIAAHDL